VTVHLRFRTGSGDSAFNYPGEENEDRVTRLRKAERIGRPVAQARPARAETKMTALSPEPLEGRKHHEMDIRLSNGRWRCLDFVRKTKWSYLVSFWCGVAVGCRGVE